MFAGKKTVVAPSAYNAEKTLQKTYGQIADQRIADRIMLVDNASADIVIMIHPGYQRTLRAVVM